MSPIKLFYTAATAWGSLGFMRGVQHYNYHTNKHNQKYYYSSSLGHGLGGVLLYGNPVLLFITIPKEIYRLEVTMRKDLQDEINTDNYKLIF